MSSIFVRPSAVETKALYPLIHTKVALSEQHPFYELIKNTENPTKYYYRQRTVPITALPTLPESVSDETLTRQMAKLGIQEPAKKKTVLMKSDAEKFEDEFRVLNKEWQEAMIIGNREAASGLLKKMTLTLNSDWRHQLGSDSLLGRLTAKHLNADHLEFQSDKEMAQLMISKAIETDDASMLDMAGVRTVEGESESTLEIVRLKHALEEINGDYDKAKKLLNDAIAAMKNLSGTALYEWKVKKFYAIAQLDASTDGQAYLESLESGPTGLFAVERHFHELLSRDPDYSSMQYFPYLLWVVLHIDDVLNIYRQKFVKDDRMASQFELFKKMIEEQEAVLQFRTAPNDLFTYASRSKLLGQKQIKVEYLTGAIPDLIYRITIPLIGTTSSDAIEDLALGKPIDGSLEIGENYDELPPSLPITHKRRAPPVRTPIKVARPAERFGAINYMKVLPRPASTLRTLSSGQLDEWIKLNSEE
jgi:hypothetical protein